MISNYTITGMTCGRCAAHITEEVSELDGVTGVNVSFESASWMTSFTAAQFGLATQRRSCSHVPGKLHSVMARGPSSASMTAETGTSAGGFASA